MSNKLTAAALSLLVLIASSLTFAADVTVTLKSNGVTGARSFPLACPFPREQ
jgi:hypothetical protein